MEILSKNLTETADLAKSFLNRLKGNFTVATVLALGGDLGSGKTTFTQFLAKELGIDNYITSPTFIIEKKYLIKNHPHFKQLVHIDCYRLNEATEMIHLDWEELIHDANNLIVVEWPKRIESILPKESIKIE